MFLLPKREDGSWLRMSSPLEEEAPLRLRLRFWSLETFAEIELEPQATAAMVAAMLLELLWDEEETLLCFSGLESPPDELDECPFSFLFPLSPPYYTHICFNSMKYVALLRPGTDFIKWKKLKVAKSLPFSTTFSGGRMAERSLVLLIFIIHSLLDFWLWGTTPPEFMDNAEGKQLSNFWLVRTNGSLSF
jgi:hypothetical protein